MFFGDTFNHRPAIKELGARFNGTNKTWIIKDSQEMRDRAALIAKPMIGDNSDINASKVSTNSTQKKQTRQITDEVDPSLGISISQLMAAADRTISQAFPTPIWVIGEIQSLATRAGGTIYFELAEGKSGAHTTATVTVKCTIWQTTSQWLDRRHGKDTLKKVISEGNRLRALVQVKLYKDRGQISLTVEDIDPSFTQGELALARAELLKKLRSQGLDQKNKMIPMPSFPLRIALITAEGSRAFSDFEHQLLSAGIFCGTMLFVPCPMQGDRVPQNVASSIKAAHDWMADIIVLCRGGGSTADLRWFDGEEIALAIAYAKIPVITAIGHHDDTCIAEEISHLREKTPTAAADRIISILVDTKQAINEKAHTLASTLDHEVTKFDRLQTNLKERLATASEQVFSHFQQNLVISSMQLQSNFELMLNGQRSNFIASAAQLSHLATNHLQVFYEGLFELKQKLTELDPAPWLKAGWTQLTCEAGRIKSVTDAEVGTEVTARLIDGSLNLRIESITDSKRGQNHAKK